jgi:hypothetical protein
MVREHAMSSDSSDTEGNECPSKEDQNDIPKDRFYSSVLKVAGTHSTVLRMLSENQPLIVLCSLSLIVASFSVGTSEEAVGYAIGAFLSFLLALAISFFCQIFTSRDSDIYIGLFVVVLYVAVISGFVLMSMVAWVFVQQMPVVAKAILIPYRVFFILMVALLLGSSHMYRRVILKESQNRWLLGRIVVLWEVVLSLIILFKLIALFGFIFDVKGEAIDILEDTGTLLFFISFTSVGAGTIVYDIYSFIKKRV